MDKNYYRIKPLKWEGKLKEETDQLTARTPFGSYTITKTENGLTWSYCFDEYYDEDYTEIKTIKEGKQKSEEHWINKISSALTKVKTGE